MPKLPPEEGRADSVRQMTVRLGAVPTVVTLCDFFGSATCYADLLCRLWRS